MKRIMIISLAMLAISAVSILYAVVAVSDAGTGKSGEALFKEHCAVCHPDGSNIVNPKKTLHKKDREANNIRTVSDIVSVMRKPGPGMSAFDPRTIPDHEAGEIAEYILKTFSK